MTKTNILRFHLRRCRNRCCKHALFCHSVLLGVGYYRLPEASSGGLEHQPTRALITLTGVVLRYLEGRDCQIRDALIFDHTSFENVESTHLFFFFFFEVLTRLMVVGVYF